MQMAQSVLNCLNFISVTLLNFEVFYLAMPSVAKIIQHG
jgi:hypothetical protein